MSTKKVVEGKSGHTYAVHADNNKAIPVVNEHGGDDIFVEQMRTEDLEGVYVSGGRTLEFAPFEYARIDIGVNLHFEDDKEWDRAYYYAKHLVKETLSREEAVMQGKKRKKLKVKGGGKYVGLSIFLGYGLTINGDRQFEKHRLSLYRKKQLPDDADLLVELGALGEEIGSKIMQEYEALKELGVGENAEY